MLSREELLRGVEDKDGLVCLLTDAVDGELLDAAEKLKVVANYAVGFNNIDVDAATERGVMVTNTPGVLTETTADLAWALIFAVARRVVEGDRLVRSGRWEGWGPLQLIGRDIAGAPLGIVGLGRIGRAMVPSARGFGMRVLYWIRTRRGRGASPRRRLRWRKTSLATFFTWDGSSSLASIKAKHIEVELPLFGILDSPRLHSFWFE